MLKLIALNYNVKLNGYSQRLNIRGNIFIGKSVLIGISDTGPLVIKNKDAIKQILKIYCHYVV